MTINTFVTRILLRRISHSANSVQSYLIARPCKFHAYGAAENNFTTAYNIS